MLNLKGEVTISRVDLVTLLNLAQTENEDWRDEYDVALGKISKKYNYPNIPKPVLEGEFELINK